MRLALTFDDGPSQWTPAILDLLAQQDVKATFFVCGFAIREHPAVAGRIADEGHEIGNHTYGHERMTHLKDRDVELELTETSKLIEAITGRYPSLWRAPYFDTDERVNTIATGLGMTHVHCTLDPGDWLNTTHRIIARVAQAVDNDIIDLHDGIPPDGGTGAPTRQATVEALPAILGMDAEFVTISELWATAA